MQADLLYEWNLSVQDQEELFLLVVEYTALDIVLQISSKTDDLR